VCHLAPKRCSNPAKRRGETSGTLLAPLFDMRATSTGQRLEPVLRGAVSLVMASAALASGCSSAPGPGIESDAGFVTASCEDTEGDWLRGLKPEPAVDYLELRQESSGSADPPAATAGEACKTAQDKPACLQVLSSAAASATGGFTLGPCADTCWQFYLVVTQGDDVATLTTRERFVSFLGAIDTPQEATMMVRLQGFDTPCRNGGAKPDGSGFIVQAFSHEGCDGLTRHLFSVDAAGKVSETSSAVLHEANPNCVVGRRPAGLRKPSRRSEPSACAHYLVDAARLEAASVCAFRHIARELTQLGAPKRLVRAAQRAAADEVRHARVTARLARRFGARRLERPRVAATAPRELEALLLDNAVEGCVRETYGAAMGLWQSRQARDPAMREAMQRIAADELRHAALAWEIAAWAEPQLDSSALARLRAARRKAVDELREELQMSPDPSLVEALGVPSAPAALELHRVLERSIWV
jgi:hypothetical protein